MPGPSILIVDDDDLMCDMLAQVLELEGFKVDLAENGSVGLEKLAAGRYDLVLLDLVMPKMDGIRFLRLLPEKCPAPPPIVIMSASVNDQIFAETRQFGVVGMARKPLQPDELVSLVREHLGAGMTGTG